jgi:hypothetical protein
LKPLPTVRLLPYLNEIAQPEVNQDAVSMNKAPRVAVYTPPNKLPWDDAVTLVLTYAEIEYDKIYDEEIVNGKLSEYDWLHLHHEDFTGQFGKFWRTYQHMPWYQQEVTINRETAEKLGFLKVSEMKAFVSKEIERYVLNGGFLFAMCAATDTYDIAHAAMGIDICGPMFDGDPADPHANENWITTAHSHSKISCLKWIPLFMNFQILMPPIPDRL